MSRKNKEELPKNPRVTSKEMSIALGLKPSYGKKMGLEKLTKRYLDQTKQQEIDLKVSKIVDKRIDALDFEKLIQEKAMDSIDNFMGFLSKFDYDEILQDKTINKVKVLEIVARAIGQIIAKSD
jgi:ribosomal protein S3AE